MTDRHMKQFTCWNQLLSLMFRQLSNRESLRDLIVTLDAHHSNVIIREWGGMFQDHPWLEPIKTETITSSRSTFTTWFTKQDRSASPIYSNLVETFLSLILQQLIYAALYYGGQSFESKKVVLK